MTHDTYTQCHKLQINENSWCKVAHNCVGEPFHTEQKKSDFLSTMNKFINEA